MPTETARARSIRGEGAEDERSTAGRFAPAVEGLDEAIARVEAARAAGAGASFVEAPGSLDEPRAIGRRAPAPNVANMIGGVRTPVLPRDRMADLGCQLILYPLTGLFAAASALEAMYRKLRADGTTLGPRAG
jgi:methylisocitrate lyase